MIAFSVEQIKTLIKLCSKNKEIELVREFRKELKYQIERDKEHKKIFGTPQFEKWCGGQRLIIQQREELHFVKEMEEIRDAILQSVDNEKIMI